MSRLAGEEEGKAEMGAFGALGGAMELCDGLIPLEHKHKNNCLCKRSHNSDLAQQNAKYKTKSHSTLSVVVVVTAGPCMEFQHYNPTYLSAPVVADLELRRAFKALSLSP